MIRALKSVWNLFFPRCCSVCDKALAESEQYLCMQCLAGLPRVSIANGIKNEVGDLFIGSKLVESAVSYFHYNRQSPYSEIIKDIKYRNCPDMGSYLAGRFTKELIPEGYFEGIDMIVPVPLHKSKIHQRGYNQSLYIAKGISAATGIRTEEALYAAYPHSTQTHKSTDERRKNVEGVFVATEDVTDKSIVLVDDVITTGATLTVCCDVLEAAGAYKVRIFSLAFASTI